jgi:hypothetical protein
MLRLFTMLTRFIFLIVLSIGLFSCTTDQKTIIARGGEVCEVLLPEYMTPAPAPDSLTTLLYTGRAEGINEVCILVDDKKNLKNLGVNSTREEFYFRATDDIITRNPKLKVSKPYHESIGLYSVIRGEVFNSEIPESDYYTLAVTETANYFFTISVKIKSKNHRKLQKEIEQILESFKEITEFKAQSAKE